MGQRPNGPDADPLLVPTRAVLVRSEKERPVVRQGRENSTIWASPSPKFVMGSSDEEKFDHPTQKPVELMRRPILIELDPKYVDVIVQRWEQLSGKKATLEADGRSFEEIAEERRGANDSSQA